TLFDAQSTSLTVTDVASSKTGSASLTVSAAAIDDLVGTPSTTTPTAGTSATAPLAAHDLYDNAATSYTGAKTITWSALATIPSPHIQSPSSPTSAITFISGARTLFLSTFVDAQSTSLTVAAVARSKTGSASLTVSA